VGGNRFSDKIMLKKPKSHALVSRFFGPLAFMPPHLAAT
jgi:hypothetical protein